MSTKVESKAVNGWDGLRQFGINALTGEACRFSRRLLCDLNEDGVRFISEYLGVSPEGFAPAWNTQVEGKPAVASVMLHRDSLREVAEFVMFMDGAVAVLASPLMGIYTQELLERWEGSRLADIRRNPAPTAPVFGSRNIHMATGRVA